MKFVKQNYEGHNHFLQIVNAYSQKMDHFIHFSKSKNLFLANILKVWWQLPLFLFILSFSYIHNHIHTVYSFIYIRRGLSPFLHCLFRSEGNTSLRCRAGIWTRACHTAGQRTTNWATLHPRPISIHLSLNLTKFWSSKVLLFMCEYEDNLFSGKRRPVLKATWILFRVQRPWHQCLCF